MEEASARQGSWAGTTLEERQGARRAKLVDAGLDLIGTEGSAGVTVRSVCRTAGLTERYFYEGFADRRAFLVAVCEEVAGEARRVLTEAVLASPPDPPVRARAVVEAFVGLVLDDPRKGRLLLVEVTSDPVIAETGNRFAGSFATLIREHLPPSAGAGPARAMAAISLLGALSHLFHAWLRGSLHVSRPQLVDHAVQVVLAHVRLAEGHGPA